jgi:hypothetical protein
VTLLRRRPIDARVTAGLAAIAGYAGAGGAMLSYFVGRSHPVVLWDVAPPGIILLGLWLGLLSQRGVGLRALAVSLALALSGAVGLVLFELRTPIVPEIKDYSVLSALAGTAAPGVSLSGSLSLMWKSPPTDPSVIAAEVMTYVAAPSTNTPTAVLIPPIEGPEVMINTQRDNALPIAYGIQDFLVKRWTQKIFRAALRLRPGTVLLVWQAWWQDSRPPPIPALRSRPVPDFPIFNPLEGIADAEEVRLALLIRRDYHVETIGRSPHGLLALRIGFPVTTQVPGG